MFDTHAHYDDEQFEKDKLEIIKKSHEEGVEYILIPSVNVASSIESLSLSQKLDYVYSAVGVHPHDVSGCNDNTIVALKDFSTSERVVAIGEIGLDYYYDLSPREAQKLWFRQQIELALEVKLPIIVHDRDAHEDTMNIIKETKAKEVGGVLHCFSGSVEMAKWLMEQGFYISIGGAVTFKNARRVVDVVKYLPLERLLLETDAPYMSPVPVRGTRNYSGNIRYIAETISIIKNIDKDELIHITTKNAKELFKIH